MEGEQVNSEAKHCYYVISKRSIEKQSRGIIHPIHQISIKEATHSLSDHVRS
jgi:hypothetical protein